MRWIAVVVFSVHPALSLQDDVHNIMQQSVEAIDRDWRAAPDYDYSERDQGKAGSRTYDVMMIAGSPYERLTAVNDQPLSADQKAREQQKLEQTIAQRRNESPDEKTRRIAQYVKERKRDHSLIEQLTQAFDFKLEGEEKMDSRDVYVLRATPRPGYHPPDMQSQVLTGMRGRLWIDKETFQWVKVEADVVHPVTIEGFLARVEPGTHFELEKIPVRKDIWFAKRFSMKSRSKIVLLFPHQTHEEETYSNYRRADSDLLTPSPGRAK